MELCISRPKAKNTTCTFIPLNEDKVYGLKELSKGIIFYLNVRTYEHFFIHRVKKYTNIVCT